MKPGTVAPIVVLAIATFVTSRALPAEPSAPTTSLEMSSDLQQLFQAEMRELLLGTQTIAGFLPIANWDGIASSAMAMRASYVLEKKLTTAQRQNLEKLPEQFKALDEAFHLRAEKVAQAAKVKDAEAVSFQFSRLLDTCVACHSIYAKARFPDFPSEGRAEHHH
jgi:cytochrome c'